MTHGIGPSLIIWQPFHKAKQSPPKISARKSNKPSWLNYESRPREIGLQSVKSFNSASPQLMSPVQESC